MYVNFQEGDGGQQRAAKLSKGYRNAVQIDLNYLQRSLLLGITRDIYELTKPMLKWRWSIKPTAMHVVSFKRLFENCEDWGRVISFMNSDFEERAKGVFIWDWQQHCLSWKSWQRRRTASVNFLIIIFGNEIIGTWLLSANLATYHNRSAVARENIFIHGPKDKDPILKAIWWRYIPLEEEYINLRSSWAAFQNLRLKAK